MKRAHGWLFLAVVLLAAGVASAQEGEKTTPPPAPSPDEVTTGEIKITLNSDYAKVRVDGGEWEEHEFLDNGKTLILHTVKRTEEHKVLLTPIYPDLAPVELTITPQDWKLASVSKNEKIWRVERKVVFTKGAPKPKAGEATDPAKK